MSRFSITEIGKPEMWLIEAATAIGLDFSGLVHEISNEFINHSLKRHGNHGIHSKPVIVQADFNRIPDIVKTPHYAIIGAIRKGSLINIYAKIIGKTAFLYFEEVLKSRRNKALRGKTFYKIQKKLTCEEFEKIVIMNKKTDISQAKKIAAGGNPGG
jgi:hypothetical protein